LGHDRAPGSEREQRPEALAEERGIVGDGHPDRHRRGDLHASGSVRRRCAPGPSRSTRIVPPASLTRDEIDHGTRSGSARPVPSSSTVTWTCASAARMAITADVAPAWRRTVAAGPRRALTAGTKKAGEAAEAAAR